jgi:selenide,water dikinase
MRTQASRILLVGGGHAHIEVLRRFALAPHPRAVLTLVSPHAAMAYSGMLPGRVAGHYTAEETQVELGPLAAAAGARFVIDLAVALDLDARTATLASGQREAFDFVSLDVGSTPDMSIPGARAHALAVKPVESFLVAWQRVMEGIAAGDVRTIAVVGGGAGGVEILLAMQYRACTAFGADAPRFALVTDQPHLLPQHPESVRARLGRVLVERDVVLHLESPAVAVEPGAVLTSGGRRIAADRIIWATSASAPAWPAAAGLDCDVRGFVALDACLRSTSHGFVFAAGDCATQSAHPRPKSGVYAVRQGPPLAHNLRQAVEGEALAPYVPQRQALALISTGGRHAIASRGRWAVEGDWVWRWKDWIDRRFLARYAPATLPAPRERKTAAD